MPDRVAPDIVALLSYPRGQSLTLSPAMAACQHSMFLLLPGLASTGLLASMGIRMKWLLCHPVERPQNNLANWISMDALDTEVFDSMSRLLTHNPLLLLLLRHPFTTPPPPPPLAFLSHSLG